MFNHLMEKGVIKLEAQKKEIKTKAKHSPNPTKNKITKLTDKSYSGQLTSATSRKWH